LRHRLSLLHAPKKADRKLCALSGTIMLVRERQAEAAFKNMVHRRQRVESLGSYVGFQKAALQCAHLWSMSPDFAKKNTLDTCSLTKT
jgi:hypothetical protein